ncbi:MAG: hypothetical protein KKG00_00220 [Bacteroidetes bacterium]|nr:hypothetical protein [Bacteroidota bacterium]
MKKLSEGKKAGENAYSRIVARGEKWKSRQIPIYIRQNLFVPWYLTAGADGEQKLFIIQYPEDKNGKVCFVEYSKT